MPYNTRRCVKNVKTHARFWEAEIGEICPVHDLAEDYKESNHGGMKTVEEINKARKEIGKEPLEKSEIVRPFLRERER